jgi:hypothetical protein
MSLVTTFGSCDPLYGSLIRCQKGVEKPQPILSLVLVYPRHQRRLPPLHRHVADGRYVQDFGACIAAHGFQFLEHSFQDSDRLLFTHLPNHLSYHETRSEAF